MQNTKIVTVLKSFSKEEFREFEKFTASPYFSRGRNLMPLLKALKKYYPAFEHKNFTRENLLKHIGKKKKTASKDLLKIQASGLYKLAEEFLSHRGSKAFPGLNTFFFVSECRQKGLYNLSRQRMSREISTTGGIGGRYYINYYFSKVEMINLSFLNDKPLEATENLGSLSEIVLHQFLCFAARFIYNLSFLKTVYNKDITGNLLLGFFEKTDYNALLRSLELKQDIHSTASRVYLLFILMQLKYDSEEYYFSFKELLFNNIEIFSAYERSVFTQAIGSKINYLMEKKNYMKYAAELFEVINFRLERNLYKQYPEAPYTAGEFFNPLVTAFILKDAGWMEWYIAKYLQEVPEENRHAVGGLSNAILMFTKGNYAAALQDISQTTGLPFLLNYELKRLQLMSYYEMNMINEAFYGLDAFRNYLKSNRNVAADFMENNLSFIKFYSHILRHKLKEEEFSPLKMAMEIESSKTESKPWLLEKTGELKD